MASVGFKALEENLAVAGVFENIRGQFRHHRSHNAALIGRKSRQKIVPLAGHNGQGYIALPTDLEAQAARLR
jgi:hypothetical protein